MCFHDSSIPWALGAENRIRRRKNATFWRVFANFDQLAPSGSHTGDTRWIALVDIYILLKARRCGSKTRRDMTKTIPQKPSRKYAKKSSPLFDTFLRRLGKNPTPTSRRERFDPLSDARLPSFFF